MNEPYKAYTMKRAIISHLLKNRSLLHGFSQIVAEKSVFICEISEIS